MCACAKTLDKQITSEETLTLQYLYNASEITYSGGHMHKLSLMEKDIDGEIFRGEIS